MRTGGFISTTASTFAPSFAPARNGLCAAMWCRAARPCPCRSRGSSSRRPERTIAAKLRQIARALEIERDVGKPGTLDRYLTLAPFGGNLEGVRAASLAYFGKEPLKLTLAEAALSGRAAAIARSAAAGSFGG